ncbi:MAG: hypothetical protein GXN91_02385, partial [Epsilonproteobacteria bacterium]|nr:hypothetical protein [Campylobacterota bacterium]
MKKWAIYSKFRDKNDIVAGTTLKDSNYFCDFSLALHTGQDREGILKNREEFMKRFNKSFKFVSLHQIHSSRVVDIDDIELKERWSELNLEADGFVTSKPNLILNILTA